MDDDKKNCGWPNRFILFCTRSPIGIMPRRAWSASAPMRRIDGTPGTPFPALPSDCRGLPAGSPHGWFMGFGGRVGRELYIFIYRRLGLGRRDGRPERQVRGEEVGGSDRKKKDLVDSQIRLYGRSSGGSVPDDRVRAILDDRLWTTTRIKKWWSIAGSNRRPPRCERGALPAELMPHGSIIILKRTTRSTAYEMSLFESGFIMHQKRKSYVGFAKDSGNR